MIIKILLIILIILIICWYLNKTKYSLETNYNKYLFQDINSFNKAEHITSDLNLFQNKIENILKSILDSPKSKFCYLTNVNNKKLIHYQKIYKKKKDLINQYIIKDFEIWNKEINNNKLLCPIYFIIDPKNKIENNNFKIIIYFNHTMIDGLDIVHFIKRTYDSPDNKYIIKNFKLNLYVPILSELIGLYFIFTSKMWNRPLLVDKKRQNINHFFNVDIDLKKKITKEKNLKFSSFLIWDFVYNYYHSLNMTSEEIKIFEKRGLIIGIPVLINTYDRLNENSCNTYKFIILEFTKTELDLPYNSFLNTIDEKKIKFKLLQAIGTQTFANIFQFYPKSYAIYKNIRKKLDLIISLLPCANNVVKSKNNDFYYPTLKDNNRFFSPKYPNTQGYICIWTYEKKIQYSFNLLQNIGLINYNKLKSNMNTNHFVK